MLTGARPSRRFCSRALPRLRPGPPSRSQFIGADLALIGPNTIAGQAEASCIVWTWHHQWARSNPSIRAIQISRICFLASDSSVPPSCCCDHLIDFTYPTWSRHQSCCVRFRRQEAVLEQHLAGLASLPTDTGERCYSALLTAKDDGNS